MRDVICISKLRALFVFIVFIVYVVHVFVCVMHVCGFNKLLVCKLDVIWGEPQTSDWLNVLHMLDLQT